MTTYEASDRRTVGNDRILPYVRVLSAVIVPFLVLAFVVLYVFPGETGRLFAWPIKATMTSMMLASAYLGGVYFFTRVALRERKWHRVGTGFVAVALFATLLGIATVVHWPLFSHDKLAFWLWAGLYLTTPFLVVGGWLANRRRAGRGSADGPLLDLLPARAIGLVGGLALVQGIVLFVAPAMMIPLWPWPLTPLTARVIGAIFCLGCAGRTTWRDRRWTSISLLIDVSLVMIVAILIAAVRARSELDPGRPLTWLLAAGFVAVLAGAIRLRQVMRRRPAAGTPGRFGPPEAPRTSGPAGPTRESARRSPRSTTVLRRSPKVSSTKRMPARGSSSWAGLRRHRPVPAPTAHRWFCAWATGPARWSRRSPSSVSATST